MMGKGTACVLSQKRRLSCDPLTSSAPSGISDFYSSPRYFLQRKDLLLLFELAATKSLVRKEVDVPGQEEEGQGGASSHFS